MDDYLNMGFQPLCLEKLREEAKKKREDLKKKEVETKRMQQERRRAPRKRGVEIKIPFLPFACVFFKI